MSAWSQESLWTQVRTQAHHCPLYPDSQGPLCPTSLHVLPFQLLQGCLHRLHLLEMAGHVCGQHHLNDQGPQLSKWTNRDQSFQQRVGLKDRRLGGRKAGIRVSGMPHAGLCSHKLILGEIDKNVHLIILHHSKNRADVVILQHRSIIVQDGAFWPVKLYVMPSPL